MEKVRLNKYLASMGICSRREIDKMVQERKITVNGHYPPQGTKVNRNDTILINGEKIRYKYENKKLYFLLNKPKKVISSVKDNRDRVTVVDLIKTKERIYPIGRLDYDTEGLIILSNDGELYNRIMHPKEKVYKTYLVKAKGNISHKKIECLKSGIMLDDELTLPAKVKLIKIENSCTWVSISIREGKNRQIRRMFASVGHKILYLKREKIGELNILDLEVGSYRALTTKEIEYLKNI